MGHLVCGADLHHDHRDVWRKHPIGDKPLKIHSSPWLGIGFLPIMFGTLIFTQLRARGIYAIIMILMGVALIGLIVHNATGWTFVFDLVTLIKVHMNLAFYVVVFVVSFVIWFYTTFVHARLTYGLVNPGEVGWYSPLTGQSETFRPLNFQVLNAATTSSSTGYWGCNFWASAPATSTSSSTCRAGAASTTFKNVWRPGAKIARLERLIQDRG